MLQRPKTQSKKQHAVHTRRTHLGVGREQVDDLDAGDEHFVARALHVERGRRAVNGREGGGVHGAAAVRGLANHVEDAAERGGAHGHGDRGASVAHLRRGEKGEKKTQAKNTRPKKKKKRENSASWELERKIEIAHIAQTSHLLKHEGKKTDS